MFRLLKVLSRYRSGGVVIELKYADDGNLEATCLEALKQIEVKKYAEGLKRRGMKTIIKYGIAFPGKEVYGKTVYLNPKLFRRRISRYLVIMVTFFNCIHI